MLTTIFITAAFGGCVAEDKLPAPTEPTEPAHQETILEVPWDIIDCQFVMAVVPVPVSNVAKFIPEGFRPADLEEMFLPNDPRGNAMVGIEGESCQSGKTLNNETLSAFQVASFWIPVVPPEDAKVSPYTGKTADMYIIKPEFTFPDEPRRQVLSDNGIKVGTATTEFTFPLMMATGPFTAKITVDGTKTFDLGGAGATSQYMADNFRDFTCQAFTPMTHAMEATHNHSMAMASPGNESHAMQLDHEYARWETRFIAKSITENGGYVTIPAGHLVSEIVGSTGQHAFYALTGVGSYTEATIHFHSEL